MPWPVHRHGRHSVRAQSRPAQQVADGGVPDVREQERNVRASNAPHVGHQLQIDVVHAASPERGNAPRTLNALLRRQVSKKSYLMTDDSNIYPNIGKKFTRHFAVNHSIEEYVRGDAHVNTAENYVSILKRGINGVYHHVSHEHLPMYLAEFDFRYNARSGLGISDPERAEKLLKGIVDKRLTYRRPDETAQH